MLMKKLWLAVIVWIPVLVGIGCNKSQEDEEARIEHAVEKAVRKEPKEEVRDKIEAVRKGGSEMRQDATLDADP